MKNGSHSIYIHKSCHFKDILFFTFSVPVKLYAELRDKYSANIFIKVGIPQRNLTQRQKRLIISLYVGTVAITQVSAIDNFIADVDFFVVCPLARVQWMLLS